MDEYELDQRIKSANNQMIGDEPGIEVMQQQVEEEVPLQQPVDLYDQNRVKMMEESKKVFPHGASTLTKKIADEALAELARSHRDAEGKSDYWESRGDKVRAKMVKDQYMEEKFLPAVEMVIIASTPDEVLNAKDILNAFDEQTFEYGPGYTASYIRTAYGDQLGNASNGSDGYVKDVVERVKFLAGDGQIRAAYGLANKAKEEIDNGSHQADDTDYEIITRVASID